MSHRRNEHRCKHWQVNITIGDDEDRVRAIAEMQYRGRTVVGIGRTQLDPSHHIPSAVSDELAVGRALSDLTRHLLAATACDIEEVDRDGTVVR